MKQTNLALHPDHRELLEKTAGEYDWNLTETVVRGVRLLAELMEIYESKAARIAEDNPEHGRLLQRVVRELGLEMLVNRGVQLGGNERDGRAALAFDDFVVVEPPTGELMAIRRVGGTVEVYQVVNGLLAQLGVFPKTEAELDWWPVNPTAE